MTANQRRPGFRLPWSSEGEETSAATASDAPASSESPTVAATADSTEMPSTTAAAEAAGATETSATSPTVEASEPPASEETAAAEAQEASTAEAHTSPDFMRDLVAAMRRVADEARQAGINEVRATADEQVTRIEAEAESRRAELRARADADVAGIGEWAKAEAERIRKEAEQRVVSRRELLEQELSTETARAETETKSLRDRIGEYERELEAYHAQLAEISDPAAFAAAAKRMPKPPSLTPHASEPPAAATAPAAAPTVPSPAPEQPATNGVTPAPDVHPAEEEVLASRLAELDADLKDAPTEAASTAPVGEPTTSEIVVSGLGSFGAITGFRQSLAGVSGIDGVALSLGQTGEFIFRATHRSGFDVAAAITGLEADAAIERRADGSLHVTLTRAR